MCRAVGFADGTMGAGGRGDRWRLPFAVFKIEVARIRRSAKSESLRQSRRDVAFREQRAAHQRFARKHGFSQQRRHLFLCDGRGYLGTGFGGGYDFATATLI